MAKRTVRFTDEPDNAQTKANAKKEKDAAFKKKLAADKADGKPPPSPCPNMVRQPDGSTKKCGGNHWRDDCPHLRDGTVGAILLGDYPRTAGFRAFVESISANDVLIAFLRVATIIAICAVVAAPASTPSPVGSTHTVLAVRPTGILPVSDSDMPPLWTTPSAPPSYVLAVASAPLPAVIDDFASAIGFTRSALARGAGLVADWALGHRLLSALVLLGVLAVQLPGVPSALMGAAQFLGLWLCDCDDWLDRWEWRLGSWHQRCTLHEDSVCRHPDDPRWLKLEAVWRRPWLGFLYGATAGAVISALYSGTSVLAACSFGFGTAFASACFMARWGKWWRYNTTYFTAAVAVYLIAIWLTGAGSAALLFGAPSALLVVFDSFKSASKALRVPGSLRRLIYAAVFTTCCVYGIKPPVNTVSDLPLHHGNSHLGMGRFDSLWSHAGLSSPHTPTTGFSVAPTFAPTSTAGSAVPDLALLERATDRLSASQRDLQLKFGDWGSWMLDTGSPFHITPFASDIDEWTSTTPTPLNGLGTGGSMASIGSGTVRIASLDKNNNTIVKVLHDVLVVPESQLRIIGVFREAQAGNHLNTRSLCIELADGASVPVKVTAEGHYVQQGVSLHHHRLPVVPANCPIPTTTTPVSTPREKGGSATHHTDSNTSSCPREKGGSATCSDTDTTTSSPTAAPTAASCDEEKGGSSCPDSAGSGSTTWSPPDLGDITYALADSRTGYNHRGVLSKFGRHAPPGYFAPAYALGHARRAALTSTGRDANDANAFSIDWKGTFATARGHNGANVVLGVKHLGSKYLRLYHFTSASTANAITAIDDFRNHMATKFGVTLSRCLMDRDSTFVSPQFTRHLESVYINPDFGGAEDHWELGSIESLWRRWACFIISALKAAGLDETFWGFASEMFEELHNALPHAGNPESMSPLAVLGQSPPDLKYLRAPFCPAYVLDHNTTSLQERARVGIMVGYPKHTRNGVWRVYFPDTKTVQTTRHVRFDEMAVVSGASDGDKQAAHDEVIKDVDALVARMQRRSKSTRSRGRRTGPRSAVQPLVRAAESDNKFVVCNGAAIDKATGYIRDRCIAMHGRRVSDCIGMPYARGDKQLTIKRRDLEYDMRRSWISVSGSAPPPFAPVAAVSPAPVTAFANGGSYAIPHSHLVINSTPTHGTYHVPPSNELDLHADERTALAAVHEAGLDVDFVAEIITPDGTKRVQLRHGAPTAQQVAPVIPGPRSVAAARRDAKAGDWLRAYHDEVKGLFDFGALHWEVCPPGHKPLRTQCVFVLKLDAQGVPTRYKARLVVDGSRQRPGEFAEVGATSASIGTFKRQCAVCAELGGTLRGGDFQLAYVHAPQPVPQWLQVPDGICREYTEDGQPMDIRVDKALYGDKGAAGLWCTHIHNWLMRYGFERSDTDPGLYRLRRSQRRRDSVSVPGTTSPTEEQEPALRTQPLSFNSSEWDQVDEDFFTLVLYTDDTSACVPPTDGCDQLYKEFVDDIQQDFRFEDKGLLSDFLSFSVKQPEPGVIILDQTFYAKNLTAQHGFGPDTQATHVPAPPGSLPHEVDCANSTDTPVDVTAFRSRVGGALWLARCTRPDISFATNSLARVSHSPGINHWHSSSHLLRYLATHPESRIEYRRSGRPAYIYVDSDFLTDCGSVDINRRATTGFAAMVANACVGHRSSRQVAAATSTRAARPKRF